MAEIKRPPLARCDCCGVTAEKRWAGSWANPEDWGHLKISGTSRGAYPNDIAMHDLCKDCNGAIFAAVSVAIDARRKNTDKELWEPTR